MIASRARRPLRSLFGQRSRVMAPVNGTNEAIRQRGKIMRNFSCKAATVVAMASAFVAIAASSAGAAEKPNDATRSAQIGVAAGRLMGAGVSVAAPARTSGTAGSSEAVIPLAVVNLGLSTTQAKNVQRWL